MTTINKYINLVLFLLLTASTNSFLLRNSTQIHTYIVHVQNPTGTKLLHDTDRENFHESFLPNATLYSGEPRLIYSYRDVISGFAARLTAEEVQAMESIDGFVHAQPDDRLSLATTYSPKFLGFSRWEEDGLWVDSSYGQGVIIGVIDGGIDPAHPSFNDNGSIPPPPAKWKGKCGFRQPSSCNKKLIGAISFRVFPGYKNQEHRSCNNASFDSLNLRGKVVACKAEGIKNIEMGKFVAKAGGVAMVVMNPFYLGSTTFSEPHFLPSAHLRYADAMKVLSYLESNSTPTATIEFDGTNFGARPSPAVATFSSRGPSLINGGILKPDVIAPGANILSSWPTSSSSSAFNFLSGTSIATPHIAGIAALLRKNHPKWSPAAIKSAIMTTADRKDLEGNPIADEYNMCKGSVFALGSGQVNPSAANDPGLVYDIQPRQYYTRYLCSLGFTSKQLKVIAQHQGQRIIKKSTIEANNN
ncbi:uncharacterized protein A4U43_C10F19390 [Asparagus officinalis]|uniref:Peptidase S8/S53 domain-containing protein n=1 Tax=Asparagus officinalis TaxID=4686 RepID=A0A5P1E490_ASPOF|nr:uncharacterized protein A4U43_C10F19390 [Asparagus officinalis]